jgi:hypothetical protein
MEAAMGSTPALDELQEIMHRNGGEMDPVLIAAIVLEIYRERHPAGNGASLQRWVEQLAVDALQARSSLVTHSRISTAGDP